MAIDMTGQRLSRRRFLVASAAAASLGLLEACSSPAAPAQTPAATKAAVSATAPAAQAPASSTTAAPAATVVAGEPKRGGTFTIGFTANLADFNPVQTAIATYYIMRPMFSTLIRQDYQLMAYPELAEKWDISADGKTVTLKLREGVKYHSGREFTSADVKFSWEYASTEPSTTQIALFKQVKAVETPEKYVAVMKLDDLNTGILDLLDTLYMLDKETFPASKANTAIGTGPFKLDKYVPNDRFEAVAFKDYWDKGKPYVDRYVGRTIPDVGSLSINLESGAIDAMQGVGATDIVRLRGTGKFGVFDGAPGVAFYAVSLNCKTPPFDNKKVRQAIAWSIDRARFCRANLAGLSQPTTLIWSPASWAYFQDLEGKLGYDLSKAAALLKEAGFEKGFDTEIVTSAKTNQGYFDLANVLQGDLAKLNIKAKIIDLDTAGWRDTFVNKREYAIGMYSYGRANRDPGTVLTAAKGFTNDKEGGLARFESPQWDSLRKDFNSTLDRQKRIPIARQIQEFALDGSWNLTVAPTVNAAVYANYVKGYSTDLDNSPLAGYVWLDR
ncbi:MAG: ABC transporter substrate-binding protein [Chloroflexi bacterium]|nr:ABC transporter substrate-binding protein [Chloroflexota bacterium]